MKNVANFDTLYLNEQKEVHPVCSETQAAAETFFKCTSGCLFFSTFHSIMLHLKYVKKKKKTDFLAVFLSIKAPKVSFRCSRIFIH